MRGLQGYTSGLAIPKYVLDTPYGKIPIAPSYVVGREDDKMVLRTYDGKIWREDNPPEKKIVPRPQEIPQLSASCACTAGRL
jgi:lysine 2,3-aminomutase